jgi:hypothetical protein
LVSVADGDDRESAALTTDRVRVSDIACAAVPVGRATARHDVFDPATPARTEPEKRPVEVVFTGRTVDHVEPNR